MRISDRTASGRLITVKSKLKITVADPDAKLSWVGGLPGIMSGENRFTLTAADGGTRLTQSRSVRGLFAAFSGLSGKILTRAAPRTQALNEAIKKRAEGS